MYLQIAGTGFVVICLIHLLETIHLPLEVLEVEDLVKHQRLDLAIEYNSSDSGTTARENHPTDTINKPRVLYQVGVRIFQSFFFTLTINVQSIL